MNSNIYWVCTFNFYWVSNHFASKNNPKFFQTYNVIFEVLSERKREDMVGPLVWPTETFIITAATGQTEVKYSRRAVRGHGLRFS